MGEIISNFQKPRTERYSLKLKTNKNLKIIQKVFTLHHCIFLYDNGTIDFGPKCSFPPNFEKYNYKCFYVNYHIIVGILQNEYNFIAFQQKIKVIYPIGFESKIEYVGILNQWPFNF